LLREHGFAAVRAAGTRRLYAVRPSPCARVDAWLDGFRKFWTPAPGRLGTELARGRRNRGRPPSSDEGSPNMIDVSHQIAAVQRTVGHRTLAAGEARGDDDQPFLSRPG
jgi:hypothetical protein